MLATVSSATLVGVDGHPVSVEVHVSNGLPGFRVVARHLLPGGPRPGPSRSYLQWLHLAAKAHNRQPGTVGPAQRGPGLDLAVALGVLAADGQIAAGPLAGAAFIAELGLDGSLRRVPGILPLVAATDEDDVIVPPCCGHEARLVQRARTRTAATLRALVQALRGQSPWPELPPDDDGPDGPAVPDLAEVRGQPFARQALEVAAAGGHHLLMVGPAGAGKTMLATRLPGLLPPLSADQALEVAMIHSAAGLDLGRGRLCLRPPFRSPHHSASAVSLIGGGGTRLRPGEISCAHRGVLFLDELAEFPAGVLDNLRQPLEEGRVVVCRASGAAVFPARFMLVAAMNACRCDADGSPGSCRCSNAARSRYVARLSGPLLDRFDLRVRVPPPLVEDLLRPTRGQVGGGPSEPSAVVAARVAHARRRARQRGSSVNAQVPPWQLDELAPVSAGARGLLERRLREGSLSARGLDRVRRVALTVADLADDDPPLGEEHVLVALALRAPGVEVESR